MTERNKPTQNNDTPSDNDIPDCLTFDIRKTAEKLHNLPKLTSDSYYGPFTRAKSRSDISIASDVILPARYRKETRNEPYPSTSQNIILQDSPVIRSSPRPSRVSTPVGQQISEILPLGDILNYSTTDELSSVNTNGIDLNVSISPISTDSNHLIEDTTIINELMDIDTHEDMPFERNYIQLSLTADNLKLIELPPYLSIPLLKLSKKIATTRCKLFNTRNDLLTASFGIKAAGLIFKSPPKIAPDDAKNQIEILRVNYISTLRTAANIKLDQLSLELDSLCSKKTLEDLIDPIIIQNHLDDHQVYSTLNCFVEQRSALIINDYIQKQKRDKETKANSITRFESKQAELSLSKTPEKRTANLEKVVLTLQRKLKTLKLSPTAPKKDQSAKKVNERKLKNLKPKNSSKKGKESKNPPKEDKKEKEKEKKKTKGQKTTEKSSTEKKKRTENR